MPPQKLSKPRLHRLPLLQALPSPRLPQSSRLSSKHSLTLPAHISNGATVLRETPDLVPLSVYCCGETPWPKSSWGEMGCFVLFFFQLQLVVHPPVKPGLEVKQRPWTDTAYWLATHGFLSLLSYVPWNHLPRDGTAHNRLGSPTSIFN